MDFAEPGAAGRVDALASLALIRALIVALEKCGYLHGVDVARIQSHALDQLGEANNEQINEARRLIMQLTFR